MAVIYEIHKYQEDDFQYVVASTNRYPETKVKNDVERMNSMLNESVRTMGIKYVFVVSDTSDSAYKERKKKTDLRELSKWLDLKRKLEKKSEEE